jgi:hypothetical protein
MSFDNILDSVIELPVEQQKSLIDIIRMRLNDKRRTEIAEDAQESIKNFRNGNFQPETAESLIERLHLSLIRPE